jgi:hypothetical protein
MRRFAIILAIECTLIASVLTGCSFSKYVAASALGATKAASFTLEALDVADPVMLADCVTRKSDGCVDAWAAKRDAAMNAISELLAALAQLQEVTK